ncbi:MAG: hypothetical protein FWC43_04820 [Planctomycetaceae bacterium]|nr:hypothetical protein [Planctomycetaceae bacterium]
MKNLPQILFFTGFGLFALVYGGFWAYGSLYKEPRLRLTKEISQYEQANEKYETQIAQMREFVQKNQQAYLVRSFPRSELAVRTLYQHWLSELAAFCDFEEPRILSSLPVRSTWCYMYRFQLQGRVSSEGFARFLFEFYWAPYLHRIVSFTLSPIENSEWMNLDMTLEGIALYPPTNDAAYPLRDKLPEGWHKRLASGPFSTYQAVAERNFLQYSKSGVDRADYTTITFINIENGEPQLWLTDRTQNSTAPIVVKQGDSVKIGSFVAAFVEADGDYAVFDHDGQYWLLEIGEPLSKAYAIPPEIR